MYQKIPLITTRNQQFTITLQINGENKPLRFIIMWNPIAGYWVLTVIDIATNDYIFDSVPFVTGQINTLSLNILRQLGYLSVGVAYLLPIVSKPKTDYPDTTNLNTEFALVWNDNG